MSEESAVYERLTPCAGAGVAALERSTLSQADNVKMEAYIY